MNIWQEHLIKYYDPNIHKNMTFNRFLLDYKRHLKKTNPTLLEWVDKNEGDVIRFIKANFSKTLSPLGRRISVFWNEST